jgi:hypothetical protein
MGTGNRNFPRAGTARNALKWFGLPTLTSEYVVLQTTVAKEGMVVSSDGGDSSETCRCTVFPHSTVAKAKVGALLNKLARTKFLAHAPIIVLFTLQMPLHSQLFTSCR